MSFYRKILIFILTSLSLAGVFASVQARKAPEQLPKSSTVEKTQVSQTKPTTPSESTSSSSKVKADERTTQIKPELSSTTALSIDQFNDLAAQQLAQLILAENAAANQGKANLVIDNAAKDVALAKTECEYTQQEQKIIHNFIPAPGGQNIAGGTYSTEITAVGAQTLAERLFEGYAAEKTGYDYLLAAGFTPEQIVNEGAQVTVAGVTYSAKGMAGTGFETSSQGGVVSHYAEIANQVPSHRATKFSVAVIYNPQNQFVSTAADFFCGNVQYVYQMNSQGQMGYVAF